MLLLRAEQFLKEHRFLQPASDTLKRIIVNQREKARQFIFEKIYSQLIEVDNDLHFTRHFMLPVKQNQRLVEDICSILATIMAHGCFIGPYYGTINARHQL